MLGNINLNADAANVVIMEKGQKISSMDGFSQLDEKSVETLCRVLHWSRWSITGVSANNGAAVLVMAATNLQEMLYFINHPKRVGRILNYDYVALIKVCKLYCQHEMEEAHKNPDFVPAIDPKYRPSNL